MLNNPYLWAARVGLFIAFFIYITEDPNINRNNNLGKFVTSAIFGSTFVPRKYYDFIGVWGTIALTNTAHFVVFGLVVAIAASLVVVLNQQILPGCARLLRKADLCSAWLFGFLMVMVIANIPWGNIWQEILASIGFSQQDTQPT